MQPYRPERIYIEDSVIDSPITQNVLAALPDVPADRIKSAEVKLAEAKTSSPTIPKAKRSLIVARNRGLFFKPCPGQQSRGSSKNVCCGYYVIDFASNCHMECTYCYLQSYLNFPYMIVYANVDDLLEELRVGLANHPGGNLRIGTGELADSLALDPLTGYSRLLVEFFAHQNNARLELKTKSDHIERLLDLDHRQRTIIAWSLNPPFIQQTEELKTASIEERLAAAEKCVAAGYPVAFHFDPLVNYDRWREGYRDLIIQLFRRIPARSIAWISMGGLRMTPELREIIKERFPRSILPYGELILAEDGKLRYFKPLRVEMYRSLSLWIEEFGAGVPIYACMERPEVWRNALGGVPLSCEALGCWLADSTAGALERIR